MFCDDGTVPEGSKMALYMKNLAESLVAAGINVDNLEGEWFKDVLESAGFVDVTVTTHKYALGAWPKDKKLKRGGRIMAQILTTGFEAYGVAAVSLIRDWGFDESWLMGVE